MRGRVGLSAGMIDTRAQTMVLLFEIERLPARPTGDRPIARLDRAGTQSQQPLSDLWREEKIWQLARHIRVKTTLEY
jgi:hypothetical protein